MINGISTNCGLITPQIFQSCDFGGSSTVTHSHIPYFNKMLCNWAYNVPMKFSWVMVINAHNRNYLINKIKSHVPSYEPPGWNIAGMADATWTESTQNTIGCIFAQGVSIPGENVNIDYAGVSESSNRGFINAPIINGRSNFEMLDAGFLETNSSFVDGVLRPWAILLSHEGLLAKPRNQSIKADITIYQLARNGECSENIIRKAITYFDCAPVYISPEQLEYSSSSDYPKLQTKFVYNHYIIDGLTSPQRNYNTVVSTNQQQIGDIAQINSERFGDSVRNIV